MKRLPLSPRLRLLCVLIAAPIVYILFFASAQPKRPAFNPYDDGLEDSYQRHSSHVIEEDDDEGWNFVPKLDNLKGLGSGLGLGKRELVLVTGGAGQLGQAILPRLLEKYDVHILDIAPRPADLPSSVTYHRGSAANPSTIGGVIKSESFAGVIHFAGVSLDAWCSARPLECQNINEGSAREVARAVAVQAQKVGSSWRGGSVPWLIMGSSTEVYGYSADKKIDEESATVPNSHLGKTMLAAEQAFTGSFRSNMRGIILRFSDVYGYPPTTAIEEGQIPTLVRNALSSLTVQFDSDSEPQDMVYVDDAVDAVMRAVDHVKELAGDVERFNVVAGPRWAIEDIVERTRTITSSLSPFVDIGDHRSFFTASEFGGAKANSVLDWTPTTALPAGLQKTISTYTKAQHAWTYGYIEDQCPSSRLLPADHAPKRNQADERNKALHNLDKCLVSLAFDHKGFLNHMKCEDGRTCHADGDYVSGYNWNSTYFIVHARKGEQERQARLMFEEEKGMGFLGMPVGLKQDEGTVWTLTEADSDEYTTDFDVEAASDSSMLTVSIPGSGSLNALSNNTDQSTFFALSPKPKFDMRMTVVCCPREGEWPLLLDDFESSDMRFGSTAQIPFNASRRSATCSRAEAAHDYTYELLKRYDSDADPNAAEYPAADLVARIPTGALDMTHKPHNWTLRELPTCWNDCNSPLVCVSTGACRCINAECPARRDNPLFTLRAAERRKAQLDADRREAQIQKSWEHAHAEEESHLGSQLGVHAFESVKDKHLLKILVDDVAKLDMTDVLLPQARAYIAKHPDFIKVFVVDDTVGQDEIEKAECHKLQDRHCFSADHILYEGFRSIQVKTPEEADLLVLPVYQQCKGVEFTIHDVQANARDNITGVREVDKRVSAVLTHDWGICIQFAWEIWSARKVLYPDWIVDNTLVFSVMGDYDSPCYRPHQDVVIPARSCRSNLLRETFPTIDKIRPMRQRPNLMTWAGTYWGTGKNDRLRLTCPRGGANLKELIKGSGPQDNWESWDYMNDLSNARFCPQPRGIAGWSPRTSDAIFAGCIPVLIAEGSHYPYANFLDWSKFSVRVQPTDLDRIEQILAGIPLEKVEEMQANLALIREGFLYSSDQNPQEEKVRKGPMWFALHEAGMRLRTRYPLIKDEGK